LPAPDRGRIRVNGEVLVDTDAGRFVPPHRRRIGMVFQDGRLFPHLSVRRNLLYGAFFMGLADRHQRLGPIVELLGIGPLLHRRPATLSGGEKQRVAIGRALLTQPRLLVLDEPLAALDQARKAEILPYLERLRDELKLPMIYVSHALDEVVRLADHLVLLEAGRVVAAGPIGAVMSRPGAGIGRTGAEPGAVLDCVVADRDEAHGLARLDFPGGHLRVPLADLTLGQRLRVHVRARDVSIALERPKDISILNMLPGRITERIDRDPAATLIRLDCAGTPLVAEVTRLSADGLGLVPGREVHALIKSVAFGRAADR
jgi:molybdate transport system ATP-binding protein